MRIDTSLPHPVVSVSENFSKSESSFIRHDRFEQYWLIVRLSPLMIFIVIFFLIPFLILLLYSFGSSTIFELNFGMSTSNWVAALSDAFYLRLLARSIIVGLFVGVLCVVMAFPFAYSITLGMMRKHAEFLLIAVLVSLFSAYVVRIYAWRTLLGRHGIINDALGFFGIGPYDVLLFNQAAVVLTLVNVLLPMAILPIYSSLAQVDQALIDSAHDLGAGPIKTFTSVSIPLAASGINAGFALCFLIAAGDYVTPQFVGGINGQMLGNVISDQFGVTFNWPLGSALAFMLVIAMGAVIGLWRVMMNQLGVRGVTK